MTVLVIGSVRGAPGVTTTALLLAGCLDGGVVAEADLDGGVLAVRYGLGREPGLTTLAAAQAGQPDAWRQHAQNAGGVPVLLGPDMPERASALWSRAGEKLASTLAASDAEVVVDVGRIRPNHGALAVLAVASMTVMLVRPEPEDLVGFVHRLPALRRSSAEVGVVLVGRGSYEARDITGELGVDVIGAVPHDPRGAEMLTTRGGSAHGLARTALARAARSLADAVVGRRAAQPPLDGQDRRAGHRKEVVR
jgi:cellulose biosynthesis protein BcsQ